MICIAAARRGSRTAPEAVERALEADIVVVAGVGNVPGHHGRRLSRRLSRVWSLPQVSIVTATTPTCRSSGPRPCLAAPAVEIVSTGRWEPGLTGYGRGTGTSDATAIIAGAAALVRSKFPDLSAEEVVHRLTATADDKGPPGRDPEYGYGIVNLVKALTADVPPLAQSSGPQPSTDQANPPASAPISASTWAVIGVLGLVALIGAVAVGVVLRRGPS